MPNGNGFNIQDIEVRFGSFQPSGTDLFDHEQRIIKLELK